MAWSRAHKENRRLSGSLREVDGIVKRIEQISGKEIPELFDDIRDHWDGENANAFYRKGMVLAERMKHTATDLRADAERLRESSE